MATGRNRRRNCVLQKKQFKTNLQMKCEKCGRRPRMYWRDYAKTTGHSEPFYTNNKGQQVCINCCDITPQSLIELNEKRKNIFYKTKKR